MNIGRFMLLGLTVVALMMTVACSDAMTWKEEVVFHDGRKVVVTRTVERGGRHEIGQPPPIREQSLQFALPKTTQEVIWEDRFSEDMGGANFLPMALEIVDDTPYLVAYPMGCQSYNKWERPNPPYVIFKFESKEWKRISLQELPLVAKRINLIFSMPDIEVEKTGKKFISAEMIREIVGRYKQPEFQSIVREPINTIGQQGCNEMIRTNDGWEGLGFFRSQRTYEACFKYCERKGVNEKDCPCNRLYK